LEYPISLHTNDKKRDCTACRRTLPPGKRIAIMLNRAGAKASGFFCTHDEAEAFRGELVRRRELLQ